MRVSAVLMRPLRRLMRVLGVLMRMFVMPRIMQRRCCRVMVSRFGVVLRRFQVLFLRHRVGPLWGV